MKRRIGGALALGATLVVTSCGLVGGPDEVFDSGVEPVDLALPAPTYAVGTKAGLVLRAGSAQRVERHATAVEWLPGGSAVVYYPRGVRLWDPATNRLGPLTVLGDPHTPVIAGDLKRSVTQLAVTSDSDHDRPDLTELVAHDLDLTEKWETPLPGVTGGKGLEERR